MKRLAVALVLVGGMTAVAFASLNTSKKKATTEKKAEKKVKRVCKHTCPFS
jgi:type II secretory pathway pseudopilin PulG